MTSFYDPLAREPSVSPPRDEAPPSPPRWSLSELAAMSIGDRMRLCAHPEWVHLGRGIHRCPACGLAGELASWLDIPDGHKRCPVCYAVKPLRRFGVIHSRPGAYCRPCASLIKRAGSADQARAVLDRQRVPV